jgi:ATP-dependent DNA helicase PIF1
MMNPRQGPRLTPEQDDLVNRLLDQSGQFVVTGAAGTGKSTVLLALVKKLREEEVYEPIVLAPSAVAALHIQGRTIHSYFGLFRRQDIASRAAYSLDAKIHAMVKKRNRMPFFILDEVSMLDRGAVW